ncbi:MAG: tetratricopeptide repeat protein [Candidatus Accumulibacter sp.]|jgi:tetratricopeptide (TPR) repeat protein|nr:tetratricopeptide repeat protein [Accumulibacter sp.]
MFPTLQTLPWKRFPHLMAGAVLAFIASFAPLAHAQTLEEVRTLMKEEKLPQALRQIDRYITAHPKDAQGPFTKGVILSEMGRPQEAIRVFLDLTEKFPELPEPHNNLAVLYARQKQYDKAQAALETAIRTHPSYAIAYENLGDLYARLASQAYSKALQLDSANRTAQSKLEMIQELASIQKYPRASPIAAAAKTSSEPEKMSAFVSPQPSIPVITAPAAATPGEKVQVDIGKAENEVATTVRNWADAWSRKDVKAYLAFYSRNFQTPKGMTLKKWETERQQRIDRPGRMQVVVDDLRVSVSGNQATARFHQQYTSATFKSQTNKILVFVKSGNKWLIVQERVN